MTTHATAVRTADPRTLNSLLDAAYLDGHRESLARVQAMLAVIHAESFQMPTKTDAAFGAIGNDTTTALIIEERMLAYEDQFIDMGLCPSAADAGDFVRGLKAIVRAHPANRHPFYTEFLPERASVPELAFYLTQESALDPRFDDFIALMQIGMAVGPKLELASNYWDEMGNGARPLVHTVMFQNSLDEVGATEQYIRDNQLVEAIVCGNLSALLALRKPLVYRAVGSFAVTEFLFPRRCSQLAEAWRRNGLSAEGMGYHREHIGIDARHASGFFKNVIAPVADGNQAIAAEVYWGALARLNSSQRYLDAALAHLTGKD